jgi:hypothetical protein
VTGDARALARHIAKLPVSDKDRLLTLVAEDQAARARMELLRGFRTDPDKQCDSRPRRTVAELLDTAGHAACSAGGERVSRLPRSRPPGTGFFDGSGGSATCRVEEPVLGEWCLRWPVEHPGMDGLDQGPRVLP